MKSAARGVGGMAYCDEYGQVGRRELVWAWMKRKKPIEHHTVSRMHNTKVTLTVHLLTIRDNAIP